MKASLLVSAAAVVAGQITYPDPSTVTMPGGFVNPVIAANQTTICYQGWGSDTEGQRKFDPTCNATAGGVPMPGPECMFAPPSIANKGGVLMSFGPYAGANPDCCHGLNDLVLGALAGVGALTAPFPVCTSQVGCGNSTVAEPTDFSTSAMALLTGKGWEPLKHTTAGFRPMTSNLPNQAAYVKASRDVFSANGAACWGNTAPWFGANYAASHPVPPMLGLSQPVFGYLDYRFKGDMNPRTPIVSITTEERFCYHANFTHDPTCATDTPIKLTAPNCAYNAFNGDLYHVFGPRAGQIPKCCNALRDLMHLGGYWAGAGAPNVACDAQLALAPSCMEAGANATVEYWKHPRTRTAGAVGPFPYPSAMIGKMANHASYVESLTVAHANDGECMSEAHAYQANNTHLGIQASLISAIMGGMQQMVDEQFPPPTTAAPTTAAPTTVAATAVASSSSATGAATTSASAAGASTDASSTDATTSAPAKAAAKVQAKVVASSFTATETLPAGATAADLLGSTSYVTTKKAALAAALSTTVSKIEITGFTISARQLLANRRSLSTADKTVVTAFEVEAADATVAETMRTTLTATAFTTTMKTALDTAVAAADFSNDSFFSANPPVVQSVSAVATPTVADAPRPAATSGAAVLGLSATLAAAVFVALF